MENTVYRVRNKVEAREVIELIEKKYGKDLYVQGDKEMFLADFEQAYASDGYIHFPEKPSSHDWPMYSDKDFIIGGVGKIGDVDDLIKEVGQGFDPVHEPAHYHLDDKGTELKDLMPALLFKFKGVEAGYVFNMIKYAVRQKDNRIQDLEKVIEYAQMAIDELKKPEEDK